MPGSFFCISNVANQVSIGTHLQLLDDITQTSDYWAFTKPITATQVRLVTKVLDPRTLSMACVDLCALLMILNEKEAIEHCFHSFHCCMTNHA